ncbi:Vsp/OspC family lipoprotein [Borrelia turicatae]|uniref:Vsp/OspC family lipoprotein n=1 Tax=Borrelia turicatae TaxID=142 RepID=UPI002ED5F9A2
MKRITFCALLMTLFLLMSCNNSGKNLKDDEVAKPDGTVIDLAKVNAEIKEATVFVAGLREVQVLVFSINDLAKVIGKKIDANGSHC